MWLCRCGFKNSNSNQKCHGQNCSLMQPILVQEIKYKRLMRSRKNKEVVSNQMGEERMMRKLKRIMGGNV